MRKRGISFLWAVMAVLLLLGARLPLQAQATDDELLKKLQQQIDQLNQRLSEQENQNKALQEQVNELLKEKQPAPAQAPVKLSAAEIPTVKTGGGEVLTIKGFIDTTFFSQDQNFEFGNGQNAEWPAPPQSEHNRWFSGGDARNTRLTLDFQGPKLANGWSIHSLIEGDVFGGYNGTGPFSNEQTTPRLRLAYVDLVKGGTTIRLGQDWTPLFGNVPVSLSHIAFPLGYGSAGMVGWRFPGVYLYQDLTGKNAPTKVQFELGLFQGSWNGPGNNLGWQSAGNVSFRPQLEARFNFSGKAAGGSWSAYVVGHYDRKDLSGVDKTYTGALHNGSLDGKAAEIGAKFESEHWLFHGNAYYGEAIGQQFGNLTQFGDIKGWGAWFQAGYNFTENWSLFAFYGIDNPNDADVRAWVPSAGRLKNQQTDFMLRYKVGPFALGLEWLHAQLDSANTFNTIRKTKGNQVALSALYAF